MEAPPAKKAHTETVRWVLVQLADTSQTWRIPESFVPDKMRHLSEIVKAYEAKMAQETSVTDMPTEIAWYKARIINRVLRAAHHAGQCISMESDHNDWCDLEEHKIVGMFMYHPNGMYIGPENEDDADDDETDSDDDCEDNV